MSEFVFSDSLPNKCKGFIERFCRLSQAPFAGRRVKLLDWQSDLITQLYGWTNPKTQRFKHQTASVWIPKKQGKSSFASAVALFNLLQYRGNAVYIIAPTTKQAGMVFNECAAMAEQDAALKARLWVRRNLRIIEDSKHFGKIEVLACSPEISGYNAGCMILDELAEWPKCYAQTVLDKIANAGDARPFYHRIILSTAQFDKEHPGYHEYREAKAVKLKQSSRTDILPIIYEVEEGADWRDPELWHKANPSCPALWPFENIEDDYKTVLASPREEARFRTLRLNQWVGSLQAWIASDTWAACSDDFKEEDLHGSEAYYGIDYARRYDLCAYSIVVPKGDSVYVMPRFFIPRAIAHKKQKLDNVPYVREWMDNPNAKLFLTDGDVVDPSFMRAELIKDCINFPPREIGFDAYGMEETRQLLAAEGLPMVEVPQTPASMGSGVAQLERLVIAKKLKHNNNPILNWNVGNCQVRSFGGSDGILLDKQKSTARIDGVSATCIALTRLLAAGSDYYDSPVLFF